MAYFWRIEAPYQPNPLFPHYPPSDALNPFALLSREEKLLGIGHESRLSLFLRLWPHIRPRHTGIAPIVSRVVFHIRIHVFNPVLIMLEHGNCTNAVCTIGEAIDHGHAVLAQHAGAHLIPTTHRPLSSYTGIIGPPEC